MNKNEALKLLQRSFDDQLSQEELNALNNVLSLSKELKKEQEKISTIRLTISQQAEQHFSPFFADRVMRKIRRQKEMLNKKNEDLSLSLIFSFRKIAIAGTVAILLLLSGNILSEGGFSFEKALGLQQVSIEDTWSLNNLISETVK